MMMELQKHQFILKLGVVVNTSVFCHVTQLTFPAPVCVKERKAFFVFLYLCYHFRREGGARTGDSCHGLLKSTLSIDLLVKLDSAYSSFLKCQLIGRKLTFKIIIQF